MCLRINGFILLCVQVLSIDRECNMWQYNISLKQHTIQNKYGNIIITFYML